MTVHASKAAPRKSNLGLALVAGATSGWALVHCGGSDPCADYVCGDAAVGPSDSGPPSADAATLAPPAPSDAGPTEAAAEADAPPGVCDPTKSPSEDACVVRDVFGVFIAVDGDDANPGTRAAPVQTMARAIDLAKTTGRPRVFVCNATYTTPLTLTGSAFDIPLSIYGGFTCLTPAASSEAGPAPRAWVYQPTTSAAFAPIAPGPALTVRGYTALLRFEDVSFTSLDGQEPGETSLAGLVSSSNVAFHRARFTAGRGADGRDGATLFVNLGTAAPGAPGQFGGTFPGGPVCSCAFGTSTGGTGANRSGGVAASPGFPAYSESPPASSVTCSGGAGGNAPAALPALPASGRGTLTEEGWKPAAGLQGEGGNPGQGGSGGGSEAATAQDTCPIEGATGGCGGCGGAPASAGSGGGGSVPLAVAEATVVLAESRLTASPGGAGGRGAEGQDGASGGAGGAQYSRMNVCGPFAVGCAGGAGGAGGKGAASGGGAGGISVGILWRGTAAPSLDDATLAAAVLGPVGAGGIGGAPGVNDGPSGVAAKVFAP